jgi:hypothetical protein
VHIAEKGPVNFVDGQTDRQTGIKPIVPSGYTGRGLINVACSSMFLIYSFSLASISFHEVSPSVSLQILRHFDFA